MENNEEIEKLFQLYEAQEIPLMWEIVKSLNIEKEFIRQLWDRYKVKFDLGYKFDFIPNKVGLALYYFCFGYYEKSPDYTLLYYNDKPDKDNFQNKSFYKCIQAFINEIENGRY